jgi:hypothetical protein
MMIIIAFLRFNYFMISLIATMNYRLDIKNSNIVYKNIWAIVMFLIMITIMETILRFVIVI